MKIVPVLFEDHNLARMRPLTWSIPQFEVRCGMFTLRERVGMCKGDERGVLLGRPVLAGLNNDPNWTWAGSGGFALLDFDARYLFINGGLAPDFSLIKRLLTLAEQGRDFTWSNENGLVAANLPRDLAAKLVYCWRDWEKENQQDNVWRNPGAKVRAWEPGEIIPGGISHRLPGGDHVVVGADALAGQDELLPLLEELSALHEKRLEWTWDIVGSTANAIRGDLGFALAQGAYKRNPFGIFHDPEEGVPDWAQETHLEVMESCLPADMVASLLVDDPGQVFCGEGVALSPGTALDTRQGPIVLDRGVSVMPHCYLEGPLYIGPGSLVKPGSRIHGESSFGIVNRIAGEIGESTFGDFANKQHEGFIGHAVLGSWINLGAMTTCSDLKNNYGEIRVDLGSGTIATGCRFVGLMMGDHAKTAIGTLFNTGTVVGFASNIFGAGMPPKQVGNFRWGGHLEDLAYGVDRAVETARLVMSRRGCQYSQRHEDLFRDLAG